MRVGVVDIGTNSMRLLVTDGHIEFGRWVEVTGLGRGVDATGVLDSVTMESTLEVLTLFGDRMDGLEVRVRHAMATSASRDASNRDAFFDRAESALGVRPTLTDGDHEARLAYAGATSDLDEVGPIVVSDIGGGSTELVTVDEAMSFDIGSVRLTDRILRSRPAPAAQLDEAKSHVRSIIQGFDPPHSALHVGVAGTWTSLAGIDLGLERYDRARVHNHVLGAAALNQIVERLSGLTIEETASIPSLDPKRAPVILAGAVVAEVVIETLGVDETVVSERDTLDGMAAELLALA